VSAAFRDLLKQNEDSEKLADSLEKLEPNCSCEAITVGEGSPGPVAPEEVLHRILSSPRDYDPVSGKVSEQPFRKAFKTGLSVWRAAGPQEDIIALMEESLYRRADDDVRAIHGVLEASVADIKSISDLTSGVCFCVYDQTVSRLLPDMPPVPTHAGVFQRIPPPWTENRTILQKDIAGKLRELFEKKLIEADAYQAGACTALNQRSKAGEFIR
jgi:hypothetical protein